MMKQWQFIKSGNPRDVLTMAEVPIPTTCADDEVLVKVSHVSLNSSVAHLLIAHYGLLKPVDALMGKPAVPEVEFSGIVCDLRGANVKEFNTGDRVLGFGPTEFWNITCGVLREYILVKQDRMAKLPSTISLKEASCLPGAGLTAYGFLIEKAKLKDGDRVFINGGSGAVGVMMIQLARTLVGPTGLVVATCSPSKRDIVQNLGANEIIDYTSHVLPDYLRDHYSSRPFDAIFDTVGIDHALYSHSPAYLTPSGLFCTIGVVEFGSTVWSVSKRIFQLLSAMALPVYLGGVPRRHSFASLNVAQSRIVTMTKLIEENAIKAVVDSTYKFTDVPDAYDRILSRKVTGKVVIEVNELE